MTYLFSTTLLILRLLWPIQAQEITPPAVTDPALSSPQPIVPIRLSTIAEANYFNQLAVRGFSLETQGLLIESLDDSTVFADLNSNIGFNPASVIKVATSFAALHKLGPDYHFETSFYADGVLNKNTGTLNGDLILSATGDPVLNTVDFSRIVRQLVRTGVRRVTGNVVVSGTLTYGTFLTADQAVKSLPVALRRAGIQVSGTPKTGEVRGTLLVSHLSNSLRDILFYQNAHSSNPTAERLGEALGGPRAVEQFLIEEIGIPKDDIFISRTSGLEFNRITPHGTVQLLRELVYWLNLKNMEPQDILPVAGIDVGTLQRRFTSVEYRGGIIGKTGTLPGTDGGVSTLAGILYTRDRGPVLFAIFNSKGSVGTYRRLQDAFVKALIMECGGIPTTVNASLHRLSN